ncbi:FAD:protein FMN transferase [Raoultibacter phocaeensis]|uniref:FAD:protein FMN transferase n=1 Tax=Raoultibacter phocaeensis TaxID=2479841 RepID=UPI00111A92CB|nr:FAD:protein FMN transferase [Raoultibacter phocaeensis]
MLTRRSFISLATYSLVGAGLAGILGGCTSAAASAAGLGAPSQGEPSSASCLSKLEAFLFDTLVRIEACCPESVLAQAEKRLMYFENIFSKTVSGSDVDLVDNAAGDAIELHPETADVIAQALAYSEASGGLFDITIGGVVDLWDFKQGIVPEQSALDEALTHVDYRAIELVGTTVRVLDPLARIDLGGIAKGYIADDIARLLADNGCESALINLGGNTYALGTKPDGSPWQVGLQDPNRARGEAFAVISVTDTSVVASGVNERSFTFDGRTYHHLLDPATGMPADNGLASVTITSASSLDGDAYTTTAFLLGLDAGMEFIEAHEGLEALFVGTDGSTTASSGMAWEAIA